MMTEIKYQNQISKQIPTDKEFRFRMGLEKVDEYFLKIDDERNKVTRINKILKGNSVFYIKERKQEIFETLLCLFPFLKVYAGSNSTFTIEECFLAIAKISEADIMVVDKDKKIIALAVCFPTGWEPSEKLGKTVSEAHQIIPKFKESVESQLSVFLDKLRLGDVYCRTNVGFLPGDYLSCAPTDNVPKITTKMGKKDIFVRLERQGITKTKNGNVIFGIKVQNVELGFFIANGENKQGVICSLNTMPDEIAEYKGIPSSGIKQHLLNLIQYF